jgi:hypothetical protein
MIGWREEKNEGGRNKFSRFCCILPDQQKHFSLLNFQNSCREGQNIYRMLTIFGLIADILHLRLLSYIFLAFQFPHLFPKLTFTFCPTSYFLGGCGPPSSRPVRLCITGILIMQHLWKPIGCLLFLLVEISLSLKFSRGIDHRYLNNIQLFNEGLVPERSGKVEYERERLAGNR